MKRIGLIGLVLLAALQLVPVDRSNPPAGATLEAPAEVMDILRRSCFDCHSNETRWPWYSRVAPMSFLVTRHVAQGRDELNLSLWRRLDRAEQVRSGAEMLEEIEKRAMPPASYLMLHGEAKLTGNELRTLRDWRP